MLNEIFMHFNETVYIIIDIDECLDYPCNTNASDCINTFGSFRCICPPGFTGDLCNDGCIKISDIYNVLMKHLDKPVKVNSQLLQNVENKNQVVVDVSLTVKAGMKNDISTIISYLTQTTAINFRYLLLR